MTTGFFGVGIQYPQWDENVGTLWRSAYQLGAGFCFVIGKVWRQQASDTTRSERNLPAYSFRDDACLLDHIPYGAALVIVEQGGIPLPEFRHPKQAVYLLGNEKRGVDMTNFQSCEGYHVVSLPSVRTNSYNVAVAGSLVMYDRVYGIKNAPTDT